VKKQPTLKEQSRLLRQNMTPTEKILWSELRGRRFAGFKFRRQQIIGSYVVGFFCAEAAIVVELDGETHLGKEYRDRCRQQWLESRGLKVLRFWDTEVYDDREAVLEAIWRECDSRRGNAAPSPPAPLPRRGEGGEK
jgi:very-short-patch-repair endonuclease